MFEPAIDGDEWGRAGTLNLNEIKIKTPNILPTITESGSMEKSPMVNTDDLDFKINVHNEWIDTLKVSRLTGKRYTYQLNQIRTNIERSPLDTSVLHYEFFSKVNVIDAQALEKLLEVQMDLYRPVIEIPYASHFDVNYKDVLDFAIRWRNDQDTDIKFMGLITKSEDIETLQEYEKHIDAFGLVVRKQTELKPMLIGVRRKLKDRFPNKWIHVFSMPKALKTFKGTGTVGVLVNYYGIDTLSTYVHHYPGVKNYLYERGKKSLEEKEAEANEVKYFNPLTYGKPVYDSFKPSQELSEFCPCYVCEVSNVAQITSDYDTTFDNTRSHEVLAYSMEASNYARELSSGTPQEYIASKNFANKFINERLDAFV